METTNGMILDYDDRQGTVPGHYALLVGEDESEPIFERVVARGLAYAHRQERTHTNAAL